MITAPDPALYRILTAIFATLTVASIVRFIALRNAEETKRRKRLASLRTWWMLAAFMSAGLLAGRLGVCLLLSAVSCIAWFEITEMFGARPQDRPAIRAGYGLIVINYLLSLFGAVSLFVVFLPISSLIIIAVLLLIMGEPKGYVRSAGGLLWGIMFLGYGISHAALLMRLPWSSSGPIGPAGWFLFLIILTEADDIFQAIVGRLFGAHKRHRITPVISPNKTWEGFFGGMLANRHSGSCHRTLAHYFRPAGRSVLARRTAATMDRSDSGCDSHRIGRLLRGHQHVGHQARFRREG